MGMGDENGINRLDDSFSQVGYLSAVEEQCPLERTDSQEEEWIVQQSPKESRFQIAERQPSFRIVYTVSSTHFPGPGVFSLVCEPIWLKYSSKRKKSSGTFPELFLRF
jgi:hypothetical protein